MASIEVTLAAALLGLLVVAGGIHLALDRDAPTGAVLAQAGGEPQRDLNLCMNECMRGCVTTPGNEKPCLARCNVECGTSEAAA